MLSIEGKRIVAESMYAKGQSFVVAAALLRKHGGSEYVVLHLLCQGIEVALKGLLLLVNYDQYKPKLKSLGHNLLKIADSATIASGLQPLRPMLRAELENLSGLYATHLLRYGSSYDIFVSASSISSRQVFRRTAALFRLVKLRGIARAPII